MSTQEYFKRLKKQGLPSTEIWRNMVKDRLEGKCIKEVRYLNDEEMDDLGWDDKCLVIILNDGNWFFPSRDDEGNGAGALFTSWEDLFTIPVIRGG